jgi:hypothetical protein
MVSRQKSQGGKAIITRKTKLHIRRIPIEDDKLDCLPVQILICHAGGHLRNYGYHSSDSRSGYSGCCLKAEGVSFALLSLYYD